MEMKDLMKYIKENSKDHIDNMCRSCSNKTDRRLIHKETKKEYPLCQNCIDKGFYNKEIFDIN
jgi:hypothetical protein